MTSKPIRMTSVAAWRAIRAFDKAERKFVEATAAYFKACAGRSVARLTTTFRAVQLAERDMRDAYSAMGKASATDTALHYAHIKGWMV